MIEVEAIRKPKHERKRRKSRRSKSQADTIRRRESSEGKFGNFEIISYAPIAQRSPSVLHLALSRASTAADHATESCILNANSNNSLLPASTSNNGMRKNLSASSSTLEFIRTSKLRTSPYRSRAMLSQEKEEKKVEKVFLSEKQSKNVKELGSFMPGAPPATPTPIQLKRIEYIPSMTDIRAQRSLQDRLQSMKKVQASRHEKQKRDREKQEKLNLIERSLECKKNQRNVIYALNEIMTRGEHNRFQEYIRRNGLGT